MAESSQGWKRLSGWMVVFCLSPLLSSCGKNKLIERIDVAISANLESARVALVFKPTIKTDLAFQYNLKEYGYIFVNPFTESTPFEVGFFLNTSILNDQEYLELIPTRYLPNGMPIGVDHPLVFIKSKNNTQNKKLEPFAYVDALEKSWIGAGTLLKFVDSKKFPNDLVATQRFLKDAQGKAQVLATIFGPKFISEDEVIPGGIAVFANMKTLLEVRSEMGSSQFSLVSTEVEKSDLKGTTLKRALNYQDSFINEVNEIQIR